MMMMHYSGTMVMMMMHYIGTMVMIIRGNWNDSSVSDNDHVEIVYFNKRRTMVTIPASHSNSSPVSESQPEQDEENQEDCGEDGRQRIVPDGHLHSKQIDALPKI